MPKPVTKADIVVQVARFLIKKYKTDHDIGTATPNVKRYGSSVEQAWLKAIS